MTEQEKALEKLQKAEAERARLRENSRETDAVYDEASLNFALSIRLARQRRKIKTSDFAARIGCSPAMLSLMESGERRWTVDVAKKAVEEVGK